MRTLAKPFYVIALGSILVVSCGSEATIRLSSSEQLVVVTSFNQIYKFDGTFPQKLSDKKLLYQFPRETPLVQGVSVHPSGTVQVSGMTALGEGWCLYNVQPGSAMKLYAFEKNLGEVLFACSSIDHLYVAAVTPNGKTRRLTVFSTDGKGHGTSGISILLHSNSFTGSGNAPPDILGPQIVAWHPNENILFFGDAEGFISRLNANTGEIQRLIEGYCPRWVYGRNVLLILNKHRKYVLYNPGDNMVESLPIAEDLYKKWVNHIWFHVDGDRFFFPTYGVEWAFFDDTIKLWEGSMSKGEVDYRGKMASIGVDMALGPVLIVDR